MKKKHDIYVKEHKLDGSHYVSAKNGFNVLTVFYQVTADVLNVILSAHDIAFTEKVISASIVKEEGGDDKLDEYARQIEAEDRAHEEAKKRREARKCCIM